PAKDAEAFLPRWKELVESLDYPAELISVHILVSDSVDGTLEAARRIVEGWQGRFRSAELSERNFGFFLGNTPGRRSRVQLRRQCNVGTCRTATAQKAAELADFCLFLDGDVSEVPADAVKTMLSARRPVVMANCLDQHGKPFDQNAILYAQRPE